MESIDGVLSTFASFIDEEVAATTMALGGLRTLAHLVVTEFERGLELQDSLLVGHNVPDVGWILRFDNAAAAKTHAERVSVSGATSQRLTQQLIVTIDTAWEHEFRQRVAAARGLAEPRAVRADFFRDIRRLRNDVVHHQGIASEPNAARCKTLLREFRVGDPIYLDDRDLLNLKLLIPWADLAGVRAID